MNDRNEVFLDLFIHPGWKMLMEDMKEAHELLLKTAYRCKTMEELFQRKGEIRQLENLLNFETIVKTQVEVDQNA